MQRAQLAPLIYRGGALFSLLAFLNACVPFPHYARVSPAVDGRVHRNQRPIENATVYIEHPKDDKCSFQSDVRTRTGVDGRFRFDVRKEFQLFLAMDPGCNWQVCIADGTSQYRGWLENGIGCPAPKLTLDCNLTDEPYTTRIGNSIRRISGICRSTKTQ